MAKIFITGKANALGPFDAVIHHAALYEVPRERGAAEGLPLLFAVNSLAPYILTALMDRPKRLIYMSSGMHLQGSGDMEALAPVAGGNPGVAGGSKRSGSTGERPVFSPPAACAPPPGRRSARYTGGISFPSPAGFRCPFASRQCRNLMGT